MRQNYLQDYTGNFSTYRVLLNPMLRTYRVASIASNRSRAEVEVESGSREDCEKYIRRMQ